jgi:hypothetical protein
MVIMKYSVYRSTEEVHEVWRVEQVGWRGFQLSKLWCFGVLAFRPPDLLQLGQNPKIAKFEIRNSKIIFEPSGY